MMQAIQSIFAVLGIIAALVVIGLACFAADVFLSPSADEKLDTADAPTKEAMEQAGDLQTKKW
jgi:hypothetical protein